MADMIPVAEDSVATNARGDVTMPAKSSIDLREYDRDVRSMPASLAVAGESAPGDESADRTCVDEAARPGGGMVDMGEMDGMGGAM